MDRAQSLTARQIKAGRALLDWSQEDLAAAANLSVATIRKLEIGHISPRGQTSHSIRRTLENGGLEFIEPSGVRQKPEDIAVYQGRDGYIQFFDDIYEVAKNKGGEFLSAAYSERPFDYLNLKDFWKKHIERMTPLQDKAKVRTIVMENKTALWATDYCEYRWLPIAYISSVEFYVYDDKLAIFVFETNPSPKITILQSKAVADAYRQQFYSMWEKASPLNVLQKAAPQSKKKSVRG